MNELRTAVIIITFICLTKTAFCATEVRIPSTISTNTTNTIVTQLDADEEAVEKWRETEKFLKNLTSLLVKQALPIMLKVSEKLNISAKCTNSFLKLLGGVKQMKTWALIMLDSFGKIPNGILTGTIGALGEYDGCLDIDVKNQFRGQYCLVDISPPLPRRTPFTPADLRLPQFVNFTKPDTVIDHLVGSAQNYYFLSLRTSVCLPSSCSREEIEIVAERVVREIGLLWTTKVPNCEIREVVPLTKSEIVILCVLGVILFTVLLSTIVDVLFALCNKGESYKEKTGILLGSLFCFSAYNNTKRLLKKDNSPDTIKFIHGMKSITVMWIILIHSYYYINLRGMGNLLKGRAFGKEIAFHVIINGFLSVETFFFMSAVLIVYGRMKSSDKQFSVFLYIFRRIWRLTPPFMLLIATSFLIPRLGSGPIWQETVGAMVDKCKKNWWTNLLYINNFIPSVNMCFQWSWYIAVDTHLYIIAIAALIPIKSRPRIGFTVIAITFIIGVIAIISTNLYYKLYGTGLYIFPHPDDINYFADYGYFKTHLHLPTYCIGMCVGYVLATKQKLRVPLLLNIAGWLVAFTMALVVLYGVYDWNQGNLPDLTISTLYTSTNKIVWSLSLAWVTIMCYTGNGGIANSILSWAGFVPFSRLTYMAYLVHPVLQHMYMGSTRALITADHRTMSFMYLGHVVAAFVVAYPLSLLFESPFMALEKVIFSKRSLPPVRKESKCIEENGNGVLHHNPKKEENGVCAVNIRKIEINS